MTRDELIDLLPLYALGHLDPEETAAVETLLATDDEARRLLAEYQAVRETFVLSTPLRQVPEHLQDDLRKRLATENALAAPTRVVAKPTPTQVALPQPTLMTPKPSLPSRGQRSRRLPITVLGGLAAALVLVAAVVLLLRAGQDPVRLYAQIASQAGARRVAVTSLEDLGIGGELVISEDRRSAVLALSDLPVITDAQTLQLWLAQANPELVVSGGLFRPMPADDGRT